MKNKNLHNINTSGFKTPDNYFESFDETLLNNLKAKSQLDAVKTNGLTVPDNYFENFDSKILSKLHHKKEVKVIKLLTWKKAIYATTIAACLVLMINTFFNNTTDWNKIETASIENYLNEEDFSNLEIASLLTDDELASYSFTDTSISETSLENYLLENTTLEDLLID